MLGNMPTGGTSATAAGQPNFSKPFLTPWLDYATVAVPDSHTMAIWWAQYMWATDGVYRTAMQRVASHFITEIEFPDLPADEENEWKDVFEKHLQFRTELQYAAEEFLCYGNLFQSIYIPFERFLKCGACGFEQPIRQVDYAVDLSTEGVRWRHKGGCRACGVSTVLTCVDRASKALDRVRYNRYYPSDIGLSFNPFSREKSFTWKPNDQFVNSVRAGVRTAIDTTPMVVLEAIARNARVEFDHDRIIHFAENSLSGMQANGWGIPRAISCFRAAWLNQLNNKMDQAVAIDYTLGMRLISPAPTNGGQDPMVAGGMEQFVARMAEIAQTHRNNPTAYYSTPYPVNYQFLGGEGGQLMPFEKLKFRQQEYLNQLGVPVEYHQGTLSVQAAPMALRLFEMFWQTIPQLYNDILAWTVKLISESMGLKSTTVKMQRTTIADDMERKSALLQLMSANQLSPQTALAPFGINAYDEAKRVIQYQEEIDKLNRKSQEKQMAEEELGAVQQVAGAPTASALMQGQPGPAQAGAPAGGMPGAGAGPQTLTQLSDQAAQLAQQLISMDEYSRGQELRNLKKGNPELHALVTQQLKEIRSAAASQGQQMVLAQQPPG